MRILNAPTPQVVFWHLYNPKMKCYIGPTDLEEKINDAIAFRGDRYSSAKEIKKFFAEVTDLDGNTYDLRKFECIGVYDDRSYSSDG
jgi:hypothetical protein